MITLTLKNSRDESRVDSQSLTEYDIFIIHKPRTNTDILIANLQQAHTSVGSHITITPSLVKANNTAARNMGLSDHLLISNPTTHHVQHKPLNLLLNCTSLTKSNFKFLPANESIKYSSVKNSLRIKIRYNFHIVKTRTMLSYNALEKLARNAHLIPSFGGDSWRQMRLINLILGKENEVVN